MTRLTSVAAILLLCAMSASAQDDGAQDEEFAQEDDSGQSDDLEYYVLEDPDDIWSDEPIAEEDYYEDETEEPVEPSEEPATPGVREPPGLPLFEAFDAGESPNARRSAFSGAVKRSFGGTRVNDGVAPWQAQIYYPGVAPQWQARIAAGTPPWVL